MRVQEFSHAPGWEQPQTQNSTIPAGFQRQRVEFPLKGVSARQSPPGRELGRQGGRKES